MRERSWSQLKRPAEPCLGLSRVEPERPLAGKGEKVARGGRELPDLRCVAGGLGEFQGLQVVVGEHLGQVLDPLPGLALDPGRGRAVAACSFGPRDLGVGDVAHEEVPERILALPRHRARTRRSHELLSRQFVQRELDIPLLAAPHLGDGVCPEDLADDCRVLEQALPLGRKRVQAGGDQRLEGVRQHRLVSRQSAVRE